jgi:GNAT superfamily N-acetyltransferase
MVLSTHVQRGSSVIQESAELTSAEAQSQSGRVEASHDQQIVIREWDRGDRQAVEDLLLLLSEVAEVRTDDAPTHVAVSGGRVIGMVTLCVFQTLTGTKAFLDHLVVAPERRRQGVGRALVQHAIDQARAAGASRIDLTAGDRKQLGHALYESLGFRERHTRNFRLSL